ncbi:MAG: SRPBCC domain-containing protein [Candidatus Binatia bacterium]
MSKNFVARATASIEAPKSKVWQALVAPDAIKQYLFGAEVESEWSEGNPIRWKGEINGQQYQDRGVILKIEPEQILQYSHFRPLSGKPDKFENYHIITIHLFGSGNKTEVLLSQDNNTDDKARRESARNWRKVLAGLKRYVEKPSGTSQSIQAEADWEPAQFER